MKNNGMNDTTNWNEYYKKKSVFSTYAQRIQRGYIIKVIDSGIDKPEVRRIVELGGADSCFFDTVKHIFDLKTFTVLDNSVRGLKNFERAHQRENFEIKTYNCDLLQEGVNIGEYDFCYSLGLIEHFDRVNTAKVISSHFDCVKKGGYVMLTFPTPTFKYRFCRKCMEMMGVWWFWDERPLKCDEVEKTILQHGEIVDKRLMKRMPLTQMLYLMKKK